MHGLHMKSAHFPKTYDPGKLTGGKSGSGGCIHPDEPLKGVWGVPLENDGFGGIAEFKKKKGVGLRTSMYNLCVIAP